MKQSYQVTLYCTTGKYRPVSAIVTTESADVAEIRRQGIIKICAKRLWSSADLKAYAYTKMKMRKVEK